MIDLRLLEAFQAAASPQALAHGRTLVAASAVEVLDDAVSHADDDIVGRVFDRGVHAVAVSSEGSARPSAFCSCAEPIPCGHLLAFAFELRPREAVPAWRKVLDAAVPATANDTAVAIFVGVRRPPPTRTAWGRKDTYLAIRPAVMGKKDAWIKGTASWNRTADLGANPVTTALLRELSALHAQQPWNSWSYSYGSHDEWVALDRLPSRNLWSLLEQLADAGVALVSDARRQAPVVLRAEPLQTRLLLTRRGQSAIVDTEAVIDGEVIDPARLLCIGDPIIGAGVIDDAGQPLERVTFVPLAEPMTPATWALLQRKSRLRVPEADVPLFERQYLPRLRRTLTPSSPDGSYPVPAAVASALLLTVDHTDGQVRLNWEWRRDASGPDPVRERAIVAAVRSAAGPHAALIFPDTDAPGADPLSRVLGRVSAVIFLTEVLPALRDVEGLEVVQGADAPDYRRAMDPPTVDVNVSDAGNDWFDLHITVTLGEETVSFEHVFTALALGDPICVLPSGTFFALDDPEFDRLREIISEARALSDRPSGPPRLSRYQTDLWSELTELSLVASHETEWLAKARAIGSEQVLESVAVPAGVHAELRDYQRSGLAWLEFLRRNRLGGVLADDMGLGKTLQTIAMMELARAEDDRMPPFLVVAPTSVVPNWQRECERFAPGLRVVTVSATVARLGADLAALTAGAHVVVTTYALFRLDFDSYRATSWSGAVFDEAQLIKNHASRGYRCARALGAPFTLVVTGTPMENNLLELWALVSLACPGLLGDRARFTEFYRTPIESDSDSDRLATLQRRLRPFMLRRRKEDVASELPPKQEQVRPVQLLSAHRRVYDRRLQRERQKVLGLIDDVAANRFQIFRSLTLLRQLALDSGLAGEEPTPSAKLEALADLLTEAVAEGHRVLVLSQFTRFLTKAQHAANNAGITTTYLDGKTRHRQRVIDDFRSGQVPVFFVSLKAGGFGLNLTEADYVVLLDPWWNPASETQAIDRTHRIGQTRSVMVYRLVATDTVEQRVVDLQARKRRLFEDVLNGAADDLGVLSADDIRDLLR